MFSDRARRQPGFQQCIERRDDEAHPAFGAWEGAAAGVNHAHRWGAVLPGSLHDRHEVRDVLGDNPSALTNSPREELVIGHCSEFASLAYRDHVVA